jgi:small subunit ribosomal protein S9
MPEKQTTKTKTKTGDQVVAIGRRKTATARVRLHRKAGDMIVNSLVIGKYFSGLVDKTFYMKPFELTGTVGKFSYTAKIEGSGKKAQLDALIHALARALVKVDPEVYKPILKKEGLLTRDARMKESRKVGTGGKARRKKQSPKR